MAQYSTRRFYSHSTQWARMPQMHFHAFWNRTMGIDCMITPFVMKLGLHGLGRESKIAIEQVSAEDF